MGLALESSSRFSKGKREDTMKQRLSTQAKPAKVAAITTRQYRFGYKATITIYENGRRLWSETSPGFLLREDAIAYARRDTVRFFWMHSDIRELDWAGNTAYPVYHD